MNDMFKKVNAREKLIGWYHTGPKLRASDLEINELFKRYTPHPLLVIIDVQPKEVGVPTDAYFAVEEIKDVSLPGFFIPAARRLYKFISMGKRLLEANNMCDIQDGTATSKTFVHTPSLIEAEEAEEIGVEHLLRDIRDVAVGTLSTRITSQLQSLQGLHLRLRDIGQYLQKVLDGDLPVNHAILGNLQDVFNLLPNLSTPKPAALGAVATNGVGPEAAGGAESGELARAMSVKTNDQLMAIYLSSLIRAITAFHDLIDNKIQNKQQAEDKENKKEESEKEKEKEKKANGEAKEGDKEKEKEKEKEGEKKKG
jgi:26S proteasome regulatory subunit N8